MICQVCGAANDLDQEFCRKCQNKLLVVSGSSETYDEGPSGEGISLDEHLLERVSVLEEIVKRSAETLKALLEGFHRQEKNGFVIQTGLLALKDLFERKGLLVEQEPDATYTENRCKMESTCEDLAACGGVSG